MVMAALPHREVGVVDVLVCPHRRVRRPDCFERADDEDGGLVAAARHDLLVEATGQLCVLADVVDRTLRLLVYGPEAGENGDLPIGPGRTQCGAHWFEVAEGG